MSHPASESHFSFQPSLDRFLRVGSARGWSIEQVERLLSAPDSTSLEGARDLAMLETMYSAGLTPQETAALALGDLSNSMADIRLRRAKGEVMVPIGSHAARAMARFLGARFGTTEHRGDQQLFAIEGSVLEPSSVSLILERYERAAGLRRRNVHDDPSTVVRGSIAVHLLDSGAHPQAVLDLMDCDSFDSLLRMFGWIDETEACG